MKESKSYENEKVLAVMAVVSMTAAMAAGCGSSEEEGKTETNEKRKQVEKRILHLTLQMIFLWHQEKMVQEQEEHSSSCWEIEEKDDEGNKIDNTTEEDKYYKQYILLWCQQ